MLSKFVNYVTEARLTFTSDSAANPLFRADIGSFAFNYAPMSRTWGCTGSGRFTFPRRYWRTCGSPDRWPMTTCGCSARRISGSHPIRLFSTGIGIVERHFPSGNIGNSGGRTYFVWSPYVVNADFKYAWWDSEDSRLNHRAGIFEQDLILNSGTETFPLFDISPAYIASVRLGDAFRIEAGVNFLHLISVDERLTSPDTLASDGSDAGNHGDPFSRTYIYVDPAANDTTFMSFAGTKAMATFSFDPKAFFSQEIFGPEDLKLYGEIALLGLNTSKAHKALYGYLKNRMPVMIGFNVPAFKLLDHLSLEVEW